MVRAFATPVEVLQLAADTAAAAPGSVDAPFGAIVLGKSAQCRDGGHDALLQVLTRRVQGGSLPSTAQRPQAYTGTVPPVCAAAQSAAPFVI